MQPVRHRARGRGAFSLLELALGMAVLALVAGAVTSIAVRHVRQEAGQKTAREILAVVDAGRAFYIGNNRWPTGIAELREAGHLPAGFSQSPFASVYALDVSGAQLHVSVTLPNDIAPGVARLLPLSATAASGGATVLSASATVPGTSSDSTSLLHRQGTLVGSTMSGPLQVSDQSGTGGTNIYSLGSNSKNVFEGNVGIGTASPGQKLQVSASEVALSLESTRNVSRPWVMRNNYGVPGNALLFIYGPGDTSDAKVTFDHNGNVGIGTTGPGAKLHVRGNSIRLTDSGSGAELEFYPSSGGSCAPSYFVLGTDPQSQQALCAKLRPQ